MYKLSTNYCRTDLRKNFLRERVIKLWNSLPVELYHFDSLSFVHSVDLPEFVINDAGVLFLMYVLGMLVCLSIF